MAQNLGLRARRSIKLWGIILGSVQNCLFISFDLGFCGFFPLRLVQINLGVGMSDLANLAKLARSNAQLPVNVYFDEALLKQEIQQLFRAGPRYAGHELMVPNVGDFATLAWENEGRMLVRSQQGIELLSTSAVIARRKCSMAVVMRRISSARCIAGPMISRVN